MKIKTLLQSILSVAAVAMLIASLAQAQTQAPAPATQPAASATSPNPASNPMLAEFLRSGAKVYYLGTQSGLSGWFITKDGQVQIGYASPDNQSLLIGVLFDAQGNNVTSEQMKNLYDTNKEVNQFFTNANNQSTLPTMPAQGNQASSASNASSLFPAASPGERLMQALQNAAGVDVGAASAPKLYMVVDPNCPHCHKTWQEIRAAVFGGKLQIRLVPIDAQGNEDSARESGQLLHVANPLDAWDKFIGGDKNQLAGNPDALSINAVRANHELIDAWHIQNTPYMVYRAKDGQAKVVQGEPEQVSAILNDIGP